RQVFDAADRCAALERRIGDTRAQRVDWQALHRGRAFERLQHLRDFLIQWHKSPWSMGAIWTKTWRRDLNGSAQALLGRFTSGAARPARSVRSVSVQFRLAKQAR